MVGCSGKEPNLEEMLSMLRESLFFRDEEG